MYILYESHVAVSVKCSHECNVMVVQDALYDKQVTPPCRVTYAGSRWEEQRQH